MSGAGVESAPIVIAFPTINDGLVLRWYASESHYATRGAIASASRERAWFADEDTAPADLRAAVEDIHQRIKGRVYRGPFGLIDEDAYAAVCALATHRPKHFLGDELSPIDEEDRR